MRYVRRLAGLMPGVIGHPAAFLAAIVLTVLWLVWGAVGGFDDTWLLVPSAAASVVTFLIVFSLQYTQNRDTRAIQLKLDEILRTSSAARTDLVKLERLTDEQLAEIEDEIVALSEEENEERRSA
jgi:low affinity Fe/Cu permease